MLVDNLKAMTALKMGLYETVVFVSSDMIEALFVLYQAEKGDFS